MQYFGTIFRSEKCIICAEHGRFAVIILELLSIFISSVRSYIHITETKQFYIFGRNSTLKLS